MLLYLLPPATLLPSHEQHHCFYWKESRRRSGGIAGGSKCPSNMCTQGSIRLGLKLKYKGQLAQVNLEKVYILPSCLSGLSVLLWSSLSHPSSPNDNLELKTSLQPSPPPLLAAPEIQHLQWPPPSSLTNILFLPRRNTTVAVSLVGNDIYLVNSLAAVATVIAAPVLPSDSVLSVQPCTLSRVATTTWVPVCER